jgi:hypothetical protein
MQGSDFQVDTQPSTQNLNIGGWEAQVARGYSPSPTGVGQQNYMARAQETLAANNYPETVANFAAAAIEYVDPALASDVVTATEQVDVGNYAGAFETAAKRAAITYAKYTLPGLVAPVGAKIAYGMTNSVPAAQAMGLVSGWGVAKGINAIDNARGTTGTSSESVADSGFGSEAGDDHDHDDSTYQNYSGESITQASKDKVLNNAIRHYAMVQPKFTKYSLNENYDRNTPSQKGLLNV